MRRSPGRLVPLELAICRTASHLREQGTPEFHGYELAKLLQQELDHQMLTAYGTLYRALGRLEKMGFLSSRWEDQEIPEGKNRPRRRLYALTGLGEAALREEAESAVTQRPRRRWAPA